MKKQIKRICAAILVILSVAGGVYSFSRPLKTELVLLEPMEVAVTFTEQGYVKEQQTLTLYTQTGGAITSLPVVEGQYVTAGELICTVSTRDYEYQIQKEQTAIRSYEAQIQHLDDESRQQKDSLNTSKNSLQGEYEALLAQETQTGISIDEQVRLQEIVVQQREQELAVARDHLHKAEILFDSGILPANELEIAQNSVYSCENALEENQQQLAVIRRGTLQDQDYFTAMKSSLLAQIDGIEHTLNQDYTVAMKRYYQAQIEASRVSTGLLEQKMADASIIAPVSGVLTALPVQDMNLVAQYGVVAVISPDNEVPLVETYVSTKYMDDIFIGMEVALVLKRQQEDIVLKGTVQAIDDKAEAVASALGIEERKVKVTIEPLVSEDQNVKPGYDAEVVFTTYFAEDKLSVPKSAVFQQDGHDMVWLCNGGRLAVAPIEIGMELRTHYVVEKGLSSQDMVVKDVNQEGLKEGKRVNNDG